MWELKMRIMVKVILEVYVYGNECKRLLSPNATENSGVKNNK